jgi:hypothetical protein
MQKVSSVLVERLAGDGRAGVVQLSQVQPKRKRGSIDSLSALAITCRVSACKQVKAYGLFATTRSE